MTSPAIAIGTRNPPVRANVDPLARRRMLRRALVASRIGTAIEWYDFFLYGVALARVFPRAFFPKSEA
jgi:hypothetical protein